MAKMKCQRDHSSVVWGNVSAGDVFDVADGYVEQIESEGLAKRIEEAPVTQEAPKYPRERARKN